MGLETFDFDSNLLVGIKDDQFDSNQITYLIQIKFEDSRVLLSFHLFSSFNFISSYYFFDHQSLT